MTLDSNEKWFCAASIAGTCGVLRGSLGKFNGVPSKLSQREPGRSSQVVSVERGKGNETVVRESLTDKGYNGERGDEVSTGKRCET